MEYRGIQFKVKLQLVYLSITSMLNLKITKIWHKYDCIKIIKYIFCDIKSIDTYFFIDFKKHI